MKQAMVSSCAMALVALLAGSTAMPARGGASTGKADAAHPDLTGYWVSQGGGPGGGPPRGGPPGSGGPPAGRPPSGAPPFPPGGGRGPGGGPGGPGGGARPQPSAAGVAAAKDYEQPYDDPAIQCDLANIL